MRRAPQGRAPHVPRDPRRAHPRADAPARPAGLSLEELKQLVEAEERARRSAAASTRRPPTRSGCGCSTRRCPTSTRSSSSSGAAATSSPASRRSCSRSGRASPHASASSAADAAVAARPRSRLLRTPPRLLPGFVAALAVAAVAEPLGSLVPVVGAPVFALALGAAVAAALGERPALRPGVSVTARVVLQGAIVVLGASLSLTRVAHVGAGLAAGDARLARGRARGRRRSLGRLLRHRLDAADARRRRHRDLRRLRDRRRVGGRRRGRGGGRLCRLDDLRVQRRRRDPLPDPRPRARARLSTRTGSGPARPSTTRRRSSRPRTPTGTRPARTR